LDFRSDNGSFISRTIITSHSLPTLGGNKISAFNTSTGSLAS
jgi:hypothetical protein